MACVSAISFLLDPFFLAIRYQSSVGPVGVIKSKDFDIFKVLTKFYLFTPSVFNLKQVRLFLKTCKRVIFCSLSQQVSRLFKLQYLHTYMQVQQCFVTYMIRQYYYLKIDLVPMLWFSDLIKCTKVTFHFKLQFTVYVTLYRNIAIKITTKSLIELNNDLRCDSVREIIQSVTYQQVPRQ